MYLAVLRLARHRWFRTVTITGVVCRDTRMNFSYSEEEFVQMRAGSLMPGPILERKVCVYYATLGTPLIPCLSVGCQCTKTPFEALFATVSIVTF